MIFTTPEFVLFALLFFAAWAALRGRARQWLLLGASYYFYGCWSWKFLTLLVGSTFLDYYVGRALERTDDPTKRKRLITISLIGNLGALGFFKYFNFFIDSAVTLIERMGFHADVHVLQIVLPVGISFYTFQTLSYALDVYRRQMKASHSLLDFALYVAFFPQLVAGPIERATHLLPQMVRLGREKLPVDWSGFAIIALGVFKKVVIADNIAPLVDMVYSDPDTAYAPAVWLATYAFAVQIYCDFSGYSDIAIGVSRLFGIELMQNFKAPYGADGPSDFWRRWHISLSTWLRDYLYIPLGGNRGGTWFIQRNLMLTMLLGGLWHGAAWNFVLWGFYQGLLLVLFRPRWLDGVRERLEAPRITRPVVVFLRRLAFFHLVCFGWALFRAENMHDCGVILQKMVDFTQWNVSGWLTEVAASGEGRYLAFTFAVVAGVVLLQMVWRAGTNELATRLWRAPAPLRFATLVALTYAGILFAPEQPPPFIYFQF